MSPVSTIEPRHAVTISRPVKPFPITSVVMANGLFSPQKSYFIQVNRLLCQYLENPQSFSASHVAQLARACEKAAAKTKTVGREIVLRQVVDWCRAYTAPPTGPVAETPVLQEPALPPAQRPGPGPASPLQAGLSRASESAPASQTAAIPPLQLDQISDVMLLQTRAALLPFRNVLAALDRGEESAWDDISDDDGLALCRAFYRFCNFIGVPDTSEPPQSLDDAELSRGVEEFMAALKPELWTSGATTILNGARATLHQQLQNLFDAPQLFDGLAARKAVHTHSMALARETFSHRGITAELADRFESYASPTAGRDLADALLKGSDPHEIGRAIQQDDSFYPIALTRAVFGLPGKQGAPTLASLSVMTDIITEYLKDDANPQRQAFANALAELQDSSSTFYALCKEVAGDEQHQQWAHGETARVERLADGQCALVPMPVGPRSSSHVMMLQIKRTEASFSVTVYNTGGSGPNVLHHPITIDLQSWRQYGSLQRAARLKPYELTGVGRDALTGEQGRAIFAMLGAAAVGIAGQQQTPGEAAEEQIYAILESLGGTRATLADRRATAAQHQGNCHWKMLTAFLKDRMSKADYEPFRQFVEDYVLNKYPSKNFISPDADYAAALHEAQKVSEQRQTRRSSADEAPTPSRVVEGVEDTLALLGQARPASMPEYKTLVMLLREVLNRAVLPEIIGDLAAQGGPNSSAFGYLKTHITRLESGSAVHLPHLEYDDGTLKTHLSTLGCDVEGTRVRLRKDLDAVKLSAYIVLRLDSIKTGRALPLTEAVTQVGQRVLQALASP